MQPARVLIVDDHALFREGIRAAIERDGEFRVVGEAADGGEALTQARTLRPELILFPFTVTFTGLSSCLRLAVVVPAPKLTFLPITESPT